MKGRWTLAHDDCHTSTARDPDLIDSSRHELSRGLGVYYLMHSIESLRAPRVVLSAFLCDVRGRSPH